MKRDDLIVQQYWSIWISLRFVIDSLNRFKKPPEMPILFNSGRQSLHYIKPTKGKLFWLILYLQKGVDILWIEAR